MRLEAADLKIIYSLGCFGTGGAAMSEAWIRRGLYFAGAWNIVGGVTALADPSRHFAQMYEGSLSLGDPIQAFFFRATWINVIAWGIGYILAGSHPSTRKGVLIAGGAGKLAYFGVCLALYLSGRGSTMLLAAGVFDIAFAAFFAYVVWARGRAKLAAA
jgi:hypothetical protein